MDRIEAANIALHSFQSRCDIGRVGSYVVVTMDTYGGRITRRWMCRGQDFYPVWKYKYPGGGTSCTALSQLVRWIQDKPVLPIESWRYWASETCRLLPMEAVDELLRNGYPEFANCVLCKNRIEGGLDWWSLNRVTGPCCSWRSGCRQERSKSTAE